MSQFPSRTVTYAPPIPVIFQEEKIEVYHASADDSTAGQADDQCAFLNGAKYRVVHQKQVFAVDSWTARKTFTGEQYFTARLEARRHISADGKVELIKVTPAHPIFKVVVHGLEEGTKFWLVSNHLGPDNYSALHSGIATAPNAMTFDQQGPTPLRNYDTRTGVAGLYKGRANLHLPHARLDPSFNGSRVETLEVAVLGDTAPTCTKVELFNYNLELVGGIVFSEELTE